MVGPVELVGERRESVGEAVGNADALSTGRSIWAGGPRVRQAMHILEHERYRWTVGHGRSALPLDNVRPGETGPVLGLRALKSRGGVYTP